MQEWGGTAMGGSDRTRTGSVGHDSVIKGAPGKGPRHKVSTGRSWTRQHIQGSSQRSGRRIQGEYGVPPGWKLLDSGSKFRGVSAQLSL